MIVKSSSYKVITSLIIVSMLLSTWPQQLWAEIFEWPHFTSVHALPNAKTTINTITEENTLLSTIASSSPDALLSELSTELGALAPDGSPNGILINAETMPK